MKEYINLNTQMRVKSKTYIMRDFNKLTKNNVFEGKLWKMKIESKNRE